MNSCHEEGPVLKCSRSFNNNLSSLVEEVVDSDDDLTYHNSGNIKLTCTVAFFRTDECTLELDAGLTQPSDMKKRKRGTVQEVGKKVDTHEIVQDDSLFSNNWFKELSNATTEEKVNFSLLPSSRGPTSDEHEDDFLFFDEDTDSA